MGQDRVAAVVLDDWAVLRSGVATVLAQCGVEVLSQTHDLAAAVLRVDRHDIDLVVLGALKGITPGLAVAALRSSRAEVAVVVLLDEPSRREAFELLDGGAAGVLARSASEEELREASMRVLRGERYLGTGLLLASGPTSADEGPDSLTERECAVLRELAEGRSNRQIADALYIGEATVKTHLHHIYEKLDVANRVQAVGRAHELRLLA